MHSFSFNSAVSLVHDFLQVIVEPGDVIIDATCGNGRDALFIAKLLKGKGSLSLYDVQEKAIHNADILLSENLSQEEYSIVTFYHRSHVCFFENAVDLIIYNLGYLPGGDCCCTTLADTTLESLQYATGILKSKGYIIVTCYPGHKEGEKEERAVEDFVRQLSSKQWTVVHHRFMNRIQAPSIFCISRH